MSAWMIDQLKTATEGEILAAALEVSFA